MAKNTTISSYVMSLIAFTLILFGAHYYIQVQFIDKQLYFPLWTIYAFNAFLVGIVYIFIRLQNEKNKGNVFQWFLGLTSVKMLLAIVFLSPLFFGKSDHKQLEVINFFIPYFLFLAFEIFSLNQFLQKS